MNEAATKKNRFRGQQIIVLIAMIGVIALGALTLMGDRDPSKSRSDSASHPVKP